MYKKLMVMIIFARGAFFYASENPENVLQKNVGIFSIANNRRPLGRFEHRCYYGTVEGGEMCAVYDGYGGPEIAQFLADTFPHYFSQTSGSIKERMIATFKNADNDEFVKFHKTVGSTASVVFIKDNIAHFAHVGDSRILLEGDDAYFVTSDHRPNRADEYVRIEHAKGGVRKNRVNGILPLSRAFGSYDMDAHKKIVIVEPEYKKIELTRKNKFLLLATGGLWSVMSNDEVIKVLQTKEIMMINDVNLFAELLVRFAALKGVRHDITVMLVDLLS